MTKDSDLPYLIALSHNQNFGFGKVSQLLRAFGSVKSAFEKSLSDFEKSGLDQKLLPAKTPINGVKRDSVRQNENIYLTAELRKNIEQAKKLLDERDLLGELEKKGIGVVSFWNENYPKALKEISSPPYILYFVGDLLALNAPMVSVIGTRMPSVYGKQVTYEIAYNLAKAGVVIVSGLALGLDSVAHQATLDAGGKTVAVLGNGLDKIYPSSNHNLGVKISQNGVVISEYPPGVPALKQNFPARNRIIAGLSRGTVVVEAKKDSGSLITANFALEQNREVFAVPGNINNPLSEGPNNLIKLGAKTITGYQDILSELNLDDLTEKQEARKIIADTKEEAVLLEHLSKEPLEIDLIVKQSGLSAQTVNSTLTMMEIKGKVRNIAGAGYITNN